MRKLASVEIIDKLEPIPNADRILKATVKGWECVVSKSDNFQQGDKVVYIEVYDRIDKPTITGKLVYPISDLFVLQWEEQKRFYPKGQVLGGLF